MNRWIGFLRKIWINTIWDFYLIYSCYHLPDNQGRATDGIWYPKTEANRVRLVDWVEILWCRKQDKLSEFGLINKKRWYASQVVDFYIKKLLRGIFFLFENISRSHFINILLTQNSSSFPLVIITLKNILHLYVKATFIILLVTSLHNNSRRGTKLQLLCTFCCFCHNLHSQSIYSMQKLDTWDKNRLVNERCWHVFLFRIY